MPADSTNAVIMVEITIPAAEPEEYHTYKFNIEDLADEYIVREGLVDPNDDDFEDMTPVELSIVVDQAKDKAYEGKVIFFSEDSFFTPNIFKYTRPKLQR